MEFLLEHTTLERDRNLIARAKAGDTEAFEVLYHQHVGRVYAVCLRIVVDTARAEELTQQAFTRAWEMLHSFRGESAFSTWLHRIAVNVVLVDLRSERRRTARIETNSEVEQFDDPFQHISPEISIDLEDAIAALPTRARAIFVLHDIEGYRHEDIAEMLTLAVGTCKAQLHRARKLLKERLTQ